MIHCCIAGGANVDHSRGTVALPLQILKALTTAPEAAAPRTRASARPTPAPVRSPIARQHALLRRTLLTLTHSRTWDFDLFGNTSFCVLATDLALFGLVCAVGLVC